jgi:hypothetical protein
MYKLKSKFIKLQRILGLLTLGLFGTLPQIHETELVIRILFGDHGIDAFDRDFPQAIRPPCTKTVPTSLICQKWQC